MSVNVRLIDGKWFEVADGVSAGVHVTGALAVYDRDLDQRDRKVVRVFGPVAWIIWDEKDPA